MSSATIHIKETLGVGAGVFGGGVDVFGGGVDVFGGGAGALLGVGAGALLGAGIGAGVCPRAFLPQRLVLSRSRSFLPPRLVLSRPRATGVGFPQHSSQRSVLGANDDDDVAASQTSSQKRSLYAAVQIRSHTAPFVVHQNGYVVFGSDSRMVFGSDSSITLAYDGVITSPYDGGILTNSYVKRFRIFGDAVVGFAGCAALFEDLKVAVNENRDSLGNPKKMAEIAEFVCCLLNKILLDKYDEDLRDLVDASFIVAGRCEDDTDVLVVERHGDGLPFFTRSSGHEAMAGSGTRAMHEYVRKNPLSIDADEMSCVRHVFGAIHAATIEDPATGGTIRVSVAGQHGWGEYFWMKGLGKDGYTGPYGPVSDDFDRGFNICLR